MPTSLPTPAAGSGSAAQVRTHHLTSVSLTPIAQGEKFDKAGAYTHRWVPEVADLPDKYLHKPWEAPDNVLLAAGVRLGDTYPHPIVDHKTAREAALSAYGTLKSLD